MIFFCHRRAGRWPDRVRLMQANWIGKSEGAEVTFNLTSPAGDGTDWISVFTTRPDTLYGASFIAIAANHPLAVSIAEEDDAASEFLAECARLGTSEAAVETAEKRGYHTGLTVRHPSWQTVNCRLYRQFRTDGIWHGCYFRARRMTSATLISPMPMICRFCRLCFPIMKIRTVLRLPIPPIPALVICSIQATGTA